MGKYRDQARKEARAIAQRLSGEITAEILDKKNTTDKVRINNYPSGDINEPEAPNLSLNEAGDLLEDLDEYEETDSAYWEGDGVREALKSCARLTYRNAVNAYFTNIIDQLNDVIGNIKIPWTLEDRYYMETDPSGRGVLDWDPNVKKLEDLPDRERARLEKKHLTMLSAEMKALVGESIKS